MEKRFVTICFCHLPTDWFARRRKELKNRPFVLTAPDHGRMVVTAANGIATALGAYTGITLADARAVIPGLEAAEDQPGLADGLLRRIAQWCIRFTPVTAIAPPAAVILDASGCAHLWGGEEKYLRTIIRRFADLGYDVQVAMADTIGASHALAHFGTKHTLVPAGAQAEFIKPLQPAALRLLPDTAARLEKLGLRSIGSFMRLQRSALQRRFGHEIIQRLDMALGAVEEIITPVQPPEMFHERLPSMEPITTEKGISIALERTAAAICMRLQKLGKGLRGAVFNCYRIDGKVLSLEIGTNSPCSSVIHVLKLFSEKIETLEPAAGIELFTLDALRVEDQPAVQTEFWNDAGNENAGALSELLDRIGARVGDKYINRYLPAEHYWPERSFERAASLQAVPIIVPATAPPRPVHLYHVPQPIQVTAPVPDYPPMNFRYRGMLHRVMRADGPERIEQEWWLQQGLHRDYYAVEDEAGQRYWIFRAGHYDGGQTDQWFLHGLFA